MPLRITGAKNRGSRQDNPSEINDAVPGLLNEIPAITIMIALITMQKTRAKNKATIAHSSSF